MRENPYIGVYEKGCSFRGERMEKEELADNLMETFKERLNAVANSNKGWNKKIQVVVDEISTGYLLQMGDDGTVKSMDKYTLKGAPEPADATIHMNTEVMEGILEKRVNPVMAMTQGLIRIEGDMSALTRLGPVFL
jgi:putative sterol carrier protein